MPGLDYELESFSLSSLDNLLYSNEILKRFAEVEKISIYCEQTRENRTKATAQKIFSVPIEVVPMGLYTEEQQLKDGSLMAEKEDVALKLSLWALESSDNLAKLRQYYEKKFEILRNTPPDGRETALKELWRRSIEQARNSSSSVEQSIGSSN